MDAEKKLIEIRGFVERVNDVGDDLALFLHAADIGDIEKADDDGFDAGIAEVILAGNLEPTPGAVFALDAVVVADPATGSGDELVDAVLSGGALIGMEQVHDRDTDEFAVEIAEDTPEAFAGVQDGAIAGKEREEFARGAQQRGELLSGKLLEAESGQLGWRTLRHSIAAVMRCRSERSVALLRAESGQPPLSLRFRARLRRTRFGPGESRDVDSLEEVRGG
jgi:hypothetical protein